MSKSSSSRRRPPGSRPKTVLSAAARRELNTKRRGELAEIAFTLKAASLGFGVAKPYGDSERYDFILDSRDVKKTCPAESGAFCPVKDLGLPRSASRSRISCPPDPSLPLLRVQVKCSTQLVAGLYRVNTGRHSAGRAVPYFPCEIDFLVAYIIPEDTWYVIPHSAIHQATGLLFRRRGDRRPGPYDKYREAWHLLRSTP